MIDKKIDELFRICVINNFDFILQREGENNFINHTLEPKKEIIVNFSNNEDKNFVKLLDEKIEELKNIIQ
jgi:hypothetical protein